MPPERLWIPRLALSRLTNSLFSLPQRFCASQRPIVGYSARSVSDTVCNVHESANCACLVCSHFSVQSFCSNSLYIIFCVSLVLYSLRVLTYFAFLLSAKYRALGLPHCTILRYKLIISIYRFTMFFSLQKSVCILCSMVGKNRRKQL